MSEYNLICGEAIVNGEYVFVISTRGKPYCSRRLGIKATRTSNELHINGKNDGKTLNLTSCVKFTQNIFAD